MTTEAQKIEMVDDYPHLPVVREADGMGEALKSLRISLLMSAVWILPLELSRVQPAKVAVVSPLPPALAIIACLKMHFLLKLILIWNSTFQGGLRAPGRKAEFSI